MKEHVSFYLGKKQKLIPIAKKKRKEKGKGSPSQKQFGAYLTVKGEPTIGVG